MDAISIAKELGNIKIVNTILLGILAKYLKISKQLWIQSIEETIPDNLLNSNLKAFESGYS